MSFPTQIDKFWDIVAGGDSHDPCGESVIDHRLRGDSDESRGDRQVNERTPTQTERFISLAWLEVFTGQIFSPNSNPPRKVGSKSIPPPIKKKLMGHPTQSISK